MKTQTSQNISGIKPTERQQSFLACPAVRARWSLWLLTVLLLPVHLALSQNATLTLADYSTNTGATIQLQGNTGETWAIQYNSALSLEGWTTLGTVSLEGTNAGVFVDSGAASVRLRFYRSDLLSSAKDTSPSQVYSVNIVGFQNVDLVPGGNIVDNPFAGTNRSISTLMPNVPDGTLLWKITSNGYAWDLNWFMQSSGWATPGMSPGVGEPFWLSNPSTAGYKITFKGEVPTGSIGRPILVGFSYCSAIFPIDTSMFPVGTQIYRWEGPNHTYDIYTYDEWGWDPVEPQFSFAEPFVLYSPQPWSWEYYRLVSYPIHVPLDVTYSPLLESLGFGRVSDPFYHWLSGCRFQAQFYGGTSGSEAEFVPLGSPVCFQSGPLAGSIAPTFIPNPFTPGSTLYYQLRVWDQNGGVNYQAALTNGSQTGKSEVRSTLTTAYPLMPILATVFPSFSVTADVIPPQIDTCAVIKLCGPIGSQYRVDWASPLNTNNWQVLSNVTLTTSPFTIIDLESTHGNQRFYRAVKQP